MASILANLPHLPLFVHRKKALSTTLQKLPISPIKERQKRVAVVVKATGESSEPSTSLGIVKSVQGVPPKVPASPAIRISGDQRSRRGLTVVTRAGLSTNSYVLAFMLPLSLLAATIFTSIRIADKLDEIYLEELEINQAIKEADDEDDDGDDYNDKEGDDDDVVDIPLEEELQPALPHTRTRNRPRREA